MHVLSSTCGNFYEDFLDGNLSQTSIAFYIEQRRLYVVISVDFHAIGKFCYSLYLIYEKEHKKVAGFGNFFLQLAS